MKSWKCAIPKEVRFLLFSLVLFFTTALPECLAEEFSKRGRNPDGTAYRTDAQGNQIVDYIAELEVTNEALERRIRGLTNEVQDLRQASKNAPSGSSRSGLIERELLSDEPMTNSPVAEVKVKTQPCEQSCGEAQCSYLIEEVVDREKRIAIERCDSSLTKLKQELKGEQDREAGEFERVRSQAGLREKSLEDLLAQRERELEQTRDQLAEAARARDDALEQYKDVKVRLAEMSSPGSAGRLSGVSAVQGGESLQPASRARASLELSNSPSSPSPSVSDADRQRVLARLQNIIQQRNKRDELFNAYNNSSLSIGRRSIRSKSGRLPEQLLGLAKATESPQQLRFLEAEAKQLEKLVVSDLLLMKRLSAR